MVNQKYVFLVFRIEFLGLFQRENANLASNRNGKKKVIIRVTSYKKGAGIYCDEVEVIPRTNEGRGYLIFLVGYCSEVFALKLPIFCSSRLNDTVYQQTFAVLYFPASTLLGHCVFETQLFTQIARVSSAVIF